jgi:hypothetical protein
MGQVTTTKRKIKFRGITADAVTLGVARRHLFGVLSGERISKSLTERYRKLKGRKI